MTAKERVLWYVDKLESDQGEVDLLYYAEMVLDRLLVSGPQQLGYRGTKKKSKKEEK